MSPDRPAYDGYDGIEDGSLIWEYYGDVAGSVGTWKLRAERETLEELRDDLIRLLGPGPLFSRGSPATAEQIAEATGQDVEDVRERLEAIGDDQRGVADDT